MKKQLCLSIFAIASFAVYGQNIKKNTRIPAHIANVAVPFNKKINDPTVKTNNSVSSKANTKRTSAFTSNIIGTTYYDLQSNSSVGDRIVVNEDGSIAAVWTFGPSSTDTDQPNRGTGYAYFNGATWSAPPTSRVESNRVGWGNIVNTRSGRELILAHDVDDVLRLSSRPTKGTGSWTESATAVPSATTSGNFWPRMVSTGDTVYAISVTQYTSASSPTYQGLKGAICFSRSKDAGATWDLVNVVPTGLDTSRYNGFGGDSYAIAANGSTVVIVAGDAGKDLTISKSVDAGLTWTKKTVLKFPIKKWNPETQTTDINTDNIPDTITTNDGTLAVGLDNSNEAFVFYGNMRILQTTPQAGGGYSYFPGTDGLVMWRETFGEDTGGVLVAQIEDLGEQGTVYFPTPSDNEVRPYGIWGNSLTSFPSVAFDASNTMYLSYSSIVDSLITITGNQEKLLRQVYVIKSSDGGVTWSSPCNIVGTPNGIPYEGMFASMAKRVDGNVHLIYQRDLAPGNGIPASGTSTNQDEPENANQVNEIVYFKFPVAEIGACNVDVSVKEQSSIVKNLNFYPNPAVNAGTIEILLAENTKIDISVMNAVGQVVYAQSNQATSGSNKIDLNLTNLSSGLYFYQVKTSNEKPVTKKFVIEK